MVIAGEPGRENDDPSDLHELEQAIYVLEELCDGKEKSEIIRKIHSDKQLLLAGGRAFCDTITGLAMTNF
ncbi:MAG: hypothetical protein AB1351_13585 [Thermoproteota archaeon]